MKPVFLHSAATADILESVEFYDARQPGLGERFEAALEETLLRIAKRPRSFTPYKGEYRKCVMNRPFPFVIYFIEFEQYIWVATVMHGSREPDSWMDRLPE